jgi:hypothetical protein
VEPPVRKVEHRMIRWSEGGELFLRRLHCNYSIFRNCK